MTTKTFLVPKDHILERILNFGSELSSYTGRADTFIFDFQGKGLDTPFGMLYLAFAIQKFIAAHPGSKHEPVHYEERGYAAHMGYFQTCGFELGNLPGQAQGSDTYIPLTVMQVSGIQAQARDEVREVGDVIEEHSRKLSSILLQQADSPAVDILTYSFREMLRNIVEHSSSGIIAFCAQFRKRTRQAEIAILDTGVGIRTTLSNNPYLSIDNDHQAINLAIMPGISGKMFKGVRKDPYDSWQNSGFGLYAVSRLCGHGGKFTLCSGDTALALKPESRKYHPSNHQGTALRIILSASEFKDARSTLAKIMKEGDDKIKELNIEEAKASAASRMLASEFEKKKPS